MGFTQVIEVEGADAQQVAEHVAAWHAEQAGVAPGYSGYRLLVDRGEQARCTILADFTSYDEAMRNNDRPETASWAAKLRELAGAAPSFRDCDTVAAS